MNIIILIEYMKYWSLRIKLVIGSLRKSTFDLVWSNNRLWRLWNRALVNRNIRNSIQNVSCCHVYWRVCLKFSHRLELDNSNSVVLLLPYFLRTDCVLFAIYRDLNAAKIGYPMDGEDVLWRSSAPVWTKWTQKIDENFNSERV